MSGPAAPASADPPQAGAAVRPPSEPREALTGEAVLVVDSAFHVVYEFDLGRMRFRGPAPRMAGPDGPTTLPGYPVLVSREPPQDATAVGSTTVVAGGVDGTAVLLDRSGGELAVSALVRLPLREVATDRGKRSSNATAGTDKPYVTLVGRLGADDVLAVAYDIEDRLSVGYALELDDRSLIVGTQLPGRGAAAAVQPYGDGAVAAMSSRRLVVLSRELRSIREIDLPGVPTHLAVDGDTAWVSITRPARLVRADLRRGTTRVVARDRRDTLGGPIAVGGDDVWWALRDRALVRRIASASGKTTDVRACEGISSLARHDGVLVLTCPGPKTFGVIEDGKPMVAYRAGNFPFSVVAPARPRSPGERG